MEFIKKMLSTHGEPSSKRVISFIGVVFYVAVITVVLAYFMVFNEEKSAIERNLKLLLIAAGSVPIAAQGMTLVPKKKS